MGSFVYYTATSLNGYIADENNSLQWLFDVGPGPESFSDFIKNVGVQVMGASTYEWLLSNENMLETPGKWQQVFGDLPTRVFTSRTLPRPDSSSFEFLKGSVSEHVEDLKALAGPRDIWVVGGGNLAAQFCDAGVLDRIHLTLAPVFLSGGTPILPRFVPSSSLRLIEARPQGQFVEIVYDVIR
jgi:dihydrofolate reductase